MTRDEAHAYLRMNAGVEAHPALINEEIEAVLDQSRVVDAAGLLITDPLYTETIWGTRAVVLALDARLTKAAQEVDVMSGGTSVLASQRAAHIKAQRASWRSRMLPGSP